MYLPTHFEETRTEVLHRFITEHPLGALVVDGPGGLDANHLPFELDAATGERGRLLAHVARANPLWQEMVDGARALVIFRGPEAYVSPNWYPSKHEAHRQVPTWNYQVVHVRGTLHIHDDDRFVRGLVARLTRAHEARAGQTPPWKMGDSARDYIDAMVAAIVGIEVVIENVTGKFKLSQNRELRDRVEAAGQLRQRGEGEIADAMLKAGPNG